MTRPLRDRAAEAMRESGIGRTRFGWKDSLDESAREEWRRRFDAFVRLGERLGFTVVDGTEKPRQPSPPSPTIYALHDAQDPQRERSVRFQGDGQWAIIITNRLTKEEKTLLVFSVEEVDRDCDLILSGNPSAQAVRGVLTKVAAANIIRSLSAEAMEKA